MDDCNGWYSRGTVDEENLKSFIDHHRAVHAPNAGAANSALPSLALTRTPLQHRPPSGRGLTLEPTHSD